MDRRHFIAGSAAMWGSNVCYPKGFAEGPKPALQAVESRNLTLSPTSSDRWDLEFRGNGQLRILQVTDTHFSSTAEKDRLSIKDLDALIGKTNPDLIVHTGDFVNNDSKKPVTWQGVEYFNSLKRPWALCFGNHDYPVEKSPGCLTLEEFHKSLNNCAMGFADWEGNRHYCYRHDVKTKSDESSLTLFYFQVGYAKDDRKISKAQLSWFRDQIKTDEANACRSPALVFVHIPLLEYDRMFESKNIAGGVKNENVCFDSDTGESFEAFAASKRVKGVFCGHDHVNNYFGTWQGIDLHYGQVSGWGGYGDLPRGGRLILVDTTSGQYSQSVVV